MLWLLAMDFSVDWEVCLLNGRSVHWDGGLRGNEGSTLLIVDPCELLSIHGMLFSYLDILPEYRPGTELGRKE